MNQPFPIRETTIFSVAEFIARGLGLFFLAQFVFVFGLTSSGELRMILPLIGTLSTMGSVGLPNAITRFLSVRRHGGSTQLSVHHLRSMIWVTLGTTLVCELMLLLLFETAVRGIVPVPRSVWFVWATPLLALICLSGSARGFLLGLGAVRSLAAATVLEAALRVLLMSTIASTAAKTLHLSGIAMGVLLMTCTEVITAAYLATVLAWHVVKKLHVESHPEEMDSLTTSWLIIRMSIPPTSQAFLASMGYSLELPLALHLLASHMDYSAASRLVATYAAVSLPLLCAPMFITDGMATALLPAMTASRQHRSTSGSDTALTSIIRAVALVAIPATGFLYFMAPELTQRFGAPSATPVLRWLSLLAFPLYLQAPLAAYLQAQGRGRALVVAGVCTDTVKLIALCWMLGKWRLHVEGVMMSFACGVLTQTAVLVKMAAARSRLTVPWQSLGSIWFSTVVMVSVLVLAAHLPPAWNLQTYPLAWSVLALFITGVYLLVAGELTPTALGRLPAIGKYLKTPAEKFISKVGDEGF